MTNFADELRRQSGSTYTDNGAKAYNTTGEAFIVDLFGMAASLRDMSDEEIVSRWLTARRETPELADNFVLYCRAIRDGGGLGERKVGRILLRALATVDPEKVKRNFQKIVDLGRWDDLFCLINTSIETDMWKFAETQLRADIIGCCNKVPISLLAKWLPSSNTSSKATRQLANRFIDYLGISPREYRKTLSRLRSYIDVTECKMSANEWNTIDYEKVPSVAMSRYIRTFNEHDYARFNKYKAALNKGEAKVNAVTLYPYDICQKYFTTRKLDAVDNAQWKALPDYLDDKNQQVLCIVDTSGSMTCSNYRPIATAVGLGVYFAQRNTGAYHNLYMTFSNRPQIMEIKDHWSLNDCMGQMYNSDWGYNTNLDMAFAKIWEIAKETGEAPTALVIISDMQVDLIGNDEELIPRWEEKFAYIGVKLPKVIFWNVNGRNTFLAKGDKGVSYVSGYGAGSFKNLTALINNTAYEAVVKILTQPIFTWD